MPSLTNLKIDDKNANKGTERGGKQLDSSLSELGIGRGIVVDRNGKIIAGNKTVEKITDLGLTDEIVIVETEGDKLVVTKRTDLDLDSDDKAIRRRSA